MVELELKNRLCFPFCQDLGNKKIKEQNLDDQINIKWSLFRIKQLYDIPGLTITGGSVSILGRGGMSLPNADFKVPGNYRVEKVNAGWTTAWNDKEYEVFMAPSDYFQDGSLFYKNSRTIYIDLPSELNEYSHLHKHSTFQFYYLFNNLFSASCGFLGCENGKIKAVVGVYASPTGTYFFWKSATIFFKWKVEVRQKIIVMDLMKESIEAIGKTAKKVGGGIVKGLTSGLVNLDGTELDALGSLLGGMGGKDNWEKMGLNKERMGRRQEYQTQELFSSTSISETMLEPSIFYSNSVQFPYNLFDYALRSFTPQWQSRIYVSENLLNNLIHNNNKNPITYPLNITFKKLGNILRKGYWQGKLTLDYDPGGKMAECFRKGVFFYEDKEKDFPNPDLGVRSVVDDIARTGMGGEIYTAQALTEPDDYVVPVNRAKGSNFHQRGHYFIFYEDGSTEHWLAMYPNYSYGSGFNNELRDGHTHGAFILNFDKPVKKMVDIYTCVGCGAHSSQRNYGQTTPGFLDLHPSYDNGSDFETIHKVPFEPWYSKLVSASLNSDNCWITADKDRCLGTKGDVWEKATQEIPGKTFTKAYGFIASDNMITWRLSSQTSKIKLQKVPQHDDFDKMDWTPPAGGGDIEIPLMEPDIPEPEPGADSMPPEPDFVPDLDITGGGEPEITIEPDITQDIDTSLDNEPDIPEPEVPEPEITPPDTEPEKPTDTEGDTGDKDPGDDEPEKPEDFD